MFHLFNFTKPFRNITGCLDLELLSKFKNLYEFIFDLEISLIINSN